MSYRIAVDVGGTFTDLAVQDRTGTTRSFKAPSTPELPARGVFDALEIAAENYGLSVEELLGHCEMFLHGSTIAMNAVIQRKVAKTGLICTEGFRDILFLSIEKGDTWNFKMAPPDPYVPRYLTLPVKERVNAQGEVLIPLDEGEVRQAIRQFKEWSVGAIAICLIFSPVNPVHERRISEIVSEEWPQVAWSISSEVHSVVREYQRTCATVLDASLKPMMRRYLQDLHKSLIDGGLKYGLLVAVSTGGVMSATVASEKPVFNLLSGPSLGPLAGLYVAEQKGVNSIITMDMGGTSFDVSMVRQGMLATTQGCTIEGGIPLGISTVDVNTIGAGGGSIAWTDPGGLIHVGPQSVGAEPGPACYGRGGEEATVTDADVVLGYLSPDNFLGGRMKIDPKLSEYAIQEKLVKPLRIGLTEAASGIFNVVNQNMASATREISISRGFDPREYLLVAAGGAGPTHAVRLAQELGMKQILVPKMAGVLCALGMLNADIKFDNVATYFTDSSRFDYEGVNRVLSELEEKGRRSLEEEGISAENMRFEYFIGTRYPFQIYEIEVPLRSNRITLEMTPQLVEDFHALHEERYSFREQRQKIELVYMKVVAVGIIPKLTLQDQPYGGEDLLHAVRGRRKAYFEELGGFVETSVYDGSRLAYGNKINGPAIIEEHVTTVVLAPNSRLTVTKRGDYFIELS